MKFKFQWINNIVEKLPEEIKEKRKDRQTVHFLPVLLTITRTAAVITSSPQSRYILPAAVIHSAIYTVTSAANTIGLLIKSPPVLCIMHL